MTPRLFVALCLRIAALIWLFFLISHTYGVFSSLGELSHPVSKTAIWLTALLQFAICAILWFFPSTIAGKLLPAAARADEPPASQSMEDWQTLGVICVGLWGLLRAIPDVIYWLTFATMFAGSDLSATDLEPRQKASMVAAILQTALSLWLVFGARGFSKLLFKIRTGGVAK